MAGLAALARDVADLQKQAVGASTDSSLARLREETAAAQAAADTFARARTREILALDVRLRPLSMTNGKPRKRLGANERRERHELLGQKQLLVGQLQRARQAALAANHIFTEVSQRRRTAFDARTFDRTASPLEAEFWTSLGDSLEADTQRLSRLASDAFDTAVAAIDTRAVLLVTLSLALAFGLAVLLRQALLRLIGRFTDRYRPVRRFHQSARALATALVNTMLPGLAAVAVNLGLNWASLLSEKAGTLAHATVIAVFWGALVLALSRQLAGGRTPSERLLLVSERMARRARSLSWLTALLTGAGFLISQVNNVVGASLAATVAANCVTSLAYAAIAGLILLALSEDRPEAADNDSALPARGAGVTLVALGLTLAVTVTVGAVVFGYSTLALLVSTQMFWVSVLAAMAYLLLRFTDDAIDELFRPGGWIGRLLINTLALSHPTVRQLGVVTAAVLQILIVLGTLSLALTPFGRNGDVLTAHIGGVGQGLRIGSLELSPRSLAAGIACLVLGLGLVHLAQRWLDRRFLPVTDWDAGVRNSVSTGVRYLGVGAVVLWALTAAGLGFSQIALIAGALSVGIGFGLQQIVQNFVSGIILLVERPIKVGDLVNVGGVEGDVKRIRVRATEILQADRTTLIVPNSDLISKPVQNKTLGDPRGRVQLQVSIGAAGDAPRAITVIRNVLDASTEVLDDPGPKVFVDALTPGGSVNFNAFGFVASQRDVVRVRSDLYIAIIEALNEAKIGFVGAGGQTVVLEPGPELTALSQKLGASWPSAGQ
ncbi:DUF3772 domain-containing protein [Sphingosinicellaceae bacterium]|nr:DUF3772 domain-containing protein [Sphingosinicellaceae bacterium]